MARRKPLLVDILRTCCKCRRTMDTDLFDLESTVCQLCVNRPASLAAQQARIMAQREAAIQRRAAMTPAERYRRLLERSSPYTDEEIDALVHRRFPDECTGGGPT